jgi:hypothetical protein
MIQRGPGMPVSEPASIPEPAVETGSISCYGMILKCANVRQNRHITRNWEFGIGNLAFAQYWKLIITRNWELGIWHLLSIGS